MPLHVTLPASVVVTDASELMRPRLDGPGVHRAKGEVLWLEGGHVRYAGPESGLPIEARTAPRQSAGGRAVLPAFVDAHTHIVFGGDRVADFDRRSRGLSYAEIAAEGGGIVTTVRATRETSTAQLTARTRGFLEQRRQAGVLTTEIKSGYGLDADTELRMLEAVAVLRAEGWDVEGTLLAAHTVPPDRPREAWVQEIVQELIPEVARRGWARFVDVFVERSAYRPDEARAIFEAALAHGLIPRIHADQLSAGGGAELAAKLGAASADHLEHISEEGIRALAESGTVAGLLPGALVHLGDSAPGLGRRLVDAGVEVAVATDANPGSSPTHNLALVATLAVTRMGLTTEEALRAVTLGAARSLRRPELGHLEPGARARLVVLDHADARAWVAAFGEPTVAEVWVQPLA